MNDEKLKVLKEVIDYVSNSMAALFRLEDIESDKELKSVLDELGNIFMRLIEYEQRLRGS